MTDNAKLRAELIQVAAVAVAIVQDLDNDTTALDGDAIGIVLQQVEYERERQEDKWGPQHHTPEEWLAILAEEVGEAAREVRFDLAYTMEAVHVHNMFSTLALAEKDARSFLKERFGPDPT